MAKHVIVIAAVLLPAIAWADGGKGSKTNSSGTQAVKARRETYIGVFTEPVSAALAAQLSELLKPGHGLLVTRVLAGSPAALAGVREFDVLTTYNDQPLKSSRQLKKLVVGGTTGQRVEFGVVRSAKRMNLEATLGQRSVSSITVSGDPTVLPPRQTDSRILQDPAGIRKRPTNSRSEDKQPEPSASGHRRSQALPRSISVAISTSNKRHYKVRINDNTTEHETKLEGTRKEIDAKLDGLPADVQKVIRRNLDQAATATVRRRLFRFQLQPRIEAGNRAIRIIMLRLGEEGQLRLFELNHRFDRQQTLSANTVLAIEPFANELRQLTPSIRKKIESTLRQVRVPEIRVNVQNSQ